MVRKHWGRRSHSSIRVGVCVRRRSWTGVIASLTAIASMSMSLILGGASNADPLDVPPGVPSDSAVIRPLGVVTPTPSDWAPKFPFPYDQLRSEVTGADITAMAEMCQWYNAQYAALRDQIDRLQFDRIAANGTDYDYSIDGVQERVDIVTTNLDNALAFLDPRVRTLTQIPNYFGDLHFSVYKGEAFFKLWEQLSNVSNGIKAHQPDWFTGPSVQKAKRWGSDIYRSHVCD
jgi:hypothetical protein